MHTSDDKSQIVDTKTATTTNCRKCGDSIWQTQARKMSYNWICMHCANQARDADDARYIARKLADSLRRKGHVKPYPGVEFVRKVIIKCEGKSALSGHACQNVRKLCIVFQQPSSGFSVENAILVTSQENVALSRQRQWQQMQTDPLTATTAGHDVRRT